MRFVAKSVFAIPIALFLALPPAPACAAERGAVIRAGELKTKPFVDAPTADKVAADQPVNIIGRQAGCQPIQLRAPDRLAQQRRHRQLMDLRTSLLFAL